MASADETQQIVIDCNKLDVQARAATLLSGLVSSFGVPDAIATLLVAAEEILKEILHLKGPMPEANAEAIERLVKQFAQHVLAHRDCAMNAQVLELAEQHEEALPKARIH